MHSYAHWLEELSPTDSLDIYRELAISHAWEGGKQGALIAALIERGKYRELCEFKVDYLEEGITAYAVKHIRQSLAFFQKIEDLDIGLDKERVAFQKFLEAEELCKETNAILRKVRRGEFSLSPRVSSVFHAASRKIARILGDVPPLGELDLHFGPGATRATRRKDASIRRKIAERLQCSEGLLQYVPYVLEEMPHLTAIHSTSNRVDEDGTEWDRVPVEITPAKLSFVPKDAKTYRSICTEPGLNTLVQLGIGSYIGRRLAAFGIDIRNQSINQDRALEGSLTGDLATLDLSSASDTISLEIVFELLPLDWAAFLEKVRSRNVSLPSGETLCQEKFSSMGNGFTFPLETLIFWSLAAACCENDGQATAFGDDLIVPTSAYNLLVEVLVAAGFKVNLQKSYNDGPFRESCGKDYFSGIPVRPYYSKGWVSAQSLFVLHNFYMRDGDTVRAGRVEDLIHPALRIYGPDGFGDGHLLGSHPRKLPPKYVSRGYSGYFFDTFTTRQARDKIALAHGEYVVPLYSIYRRSDGDRFIPVKGRLQHPSNSYESLPTRALLACRGLGSGNTAPLSLPEGKDEVKMISLPGVTGYKKISIYTLGG